MPECAMCTDKADGICSKCNHMLCTYHYNNHRDVATCANSWCKNIANSPSGKCPGCHRAMFTNK